MNTIEFALDMRKKYADGDLNDESVVKEINENIIVFLKGKSKGELYEKIYNGILEGKTQVSIAKECGVNNSMVAECMVTIRRLIDLLRHVGIDLKHFQKFDCRPYKFKEETLKKMDERRNIQRNRRG